MSYVIYARKSTESEDRQVASIEAQISELRRLAAGRGVEVAEVLTESQSAKSPGRPIFTDLMKRVGKGQVQGILAWKMDRLARNHLDTGAVLQALADGQLERVITIDREYTKDGNDRFIGQFELGIATKFIDDLRQNVLRGNRARFQRGWPNHNPPLGYLLDPVTKEVVNDPDRFSLVRRMWDLMLSGTHRPAQICRIANEEWGLTSRTFKRIGGGAVGLSTVYTIFANKFYMGINQLKSGERYPGAHQPMVTPEEFERVQQLLAERGRSRPKRHEFSFTGLFACGSCNCRITAEEHIKPSGRRYVYYRCTHQSRTRPCQEKALPEPEVENQIAGFLARLSMPAPVFDWLLALNRRFLNLEQETMEQVQASLKEKLSDLDRQKETLLDLRLRRQVDDEVYTRKLEALEQSGLSYQHKLAQQGRARELTGLVESVLRFAKNAVDVFRAGDMVQKRGIFRAVALNPTIQGQKVLMELKKPFEILSRAAEMSDWCSTVEDIRTWMLETDEYFELPEALLTASTSCSVTRSRDSGQEVNDLRTAHPVDNTRR